jgi:hypothetical protein
VESLPQARQAFIGTTEEIVGGGAGVCQDAMAHESGPIYAVAQSCTLGIDTPDQRHAVGNKQIKILRDCSELRLVSAQGDDLSIREIDHRSTGLTK